MENRMYTRYLEEVVPTLDAGVRLYVNPMQVPTISKITLNIGVGEAVDEPRSLDGAVEDSEDHHRAAAGGHPKAKKSIATYTSCAKAGR